MYLIWNVMNWYTNGTNTYTSYNLADLRNTQSNNYQMQNTLIQRPQYTYKKVSKIIFIRQPIRVHS